MRQNKIFMKIGDELENNDAIKNEKSPNSPRYVFPRSEVVLLTFSD